jgi:hypothetical protein
MQSEPKPEPQIFNQNVLVIKNVDESCIVIHHDIVLLRKKLPMNERIFLETLKKIVRHHTKYGDIVAMLRTGGFSINDYAVDGIYKVLIGDIEITLYDVEKVWKGFGWDILNFKGVKVEKIHIIRDYRGE